MKRLFLIAIITILGLSLLTAEEVVFNVNMSYQIELGNFNPDVDFVDVAGNFNDWSGSGAMADPEEDGTYTITVDSLEIGFVCEYKFRINANWDNSEFPGGDDREYTVIDGENIVTHWYNDQEPPVGDPAPITFIVDDSIEQTHSIFYLKGSWDANGMYDPNWGGGVEHTQFYDDGTHGDEVANDHIFTVTMELYPDEGDNTWEWGINDSSHTWLDGNWTFHVIDDSPQTLSWIVPTMTDIDVTVTFQVDMNVIETADSVFVAGSFNNWNMTEIEMTDADEDGIFVADYTIPAESTYNQSYKFINGTRWELGFGDRMFMVDDTDSTQTLEVVTFNNFEYDNFTSQDVDVTFKIDMTNLDSLWYNNGVYMRGNVMPLTADGSDNVLTDNNGDGIYEKTVTFPSGSHKDVTFVYGRIDNDLVSWEEFNEGNWRTFTINDDNSQQVLETVEWGDYVSNSNDVIETTNFALTNYPNPFNPETNISFYLEKETSVNLAIYNLKGQKVRTLIQSNLSSGNQTIVWKGKNDAGKSVASGLYFYKLEIEKGTQVQKMMLMK